MSTAKDLTLAYLRMHPTEAARVLEQLPFAETAVLLGAVPGRIAAPVLSRLVPSFAARSLANVADDSVVRLLRRLTTPAAAAVLRHIGEERRARLLGELPSAMAVACRLLLRYPEDSVGALADTTVLTLLPATPVREVLARFKSAQDDVGDFLYVVDDERFLRACLRPAALLHVTGTMSVGALDPVPVSRLAAQAAPRSVRDHPGWNSFSTLPVVDRDGRLIGALRQSVLMQALDRTPAPVRTGTEPSTLVALGDAGWSAAATLLHAAVGVLPVSRRGQP
jgi:magnesium transporter